MPIPRVKTVATSVESPQSLCGENWDKNVQVRQPYKGTDEFFRDMLSLGEKTQLQSRDPELIEQTKWELNRVKKLLAQLRDRLDAGQSARVDTYLARARTYLNDAQKLQASWKLGFETKSYGKVMPFALHITFAEIGDGFCVTKGPGYKAQASGEFDCPTKEEIVGHDKDAQKWKVLVGAALKNIRCSEELMRKAEVFSLNKNYHVEPPKPALAIQEPLEEEIEEEGEGVLGDQGDAQDEEKPRKKRKKSTAPLIVAAGIGALLVLK